MDAMNKLTVLAEVAWAFCDGSEGGLKGDRATLPILGRQLFSEGPVLPPSAIRRAPKCAPTMYVWSTPGLRLIYA